MNFYLFYGSDKALLNKEILNLKIKLSISDNDTIYYDITSINDIIEEAMTVSMFSLNKFLIIDATSYFCEKKDIPDIKKLESYFDSYNPNSYLVFISNGDSIDSRKKLFKLISSKGKVSKLEITNNYLSNYVNDYLTSLGYKMDNISMSYFLSRSGNNIDNITNELDKLMLYKINDKVITKDDISLLVEENLDNTIYDLVNSILRNDKSTAIKLYDKFLLNGTDVSQIINLLSSQIRLLFQVKRLYNKVKSNQEIASILDISNVYRIKYLLNDSYYYREEDLIKYLSKLAEMDKNIKLGNIDGDIFLQLFIMEKDM